jgi:hypothetical protein
MEKSWGDTSENMRIGCGSRREAIIVTERIIPVVKNIKQKNVDLRNSFTVI